jgi:hypothetical protein
VKIFKTIATYLSRWELFLLAALLPFWLLLRPAFTPFFLIIPLIWLAAYFRTDRFFPLTRLDLTLFLLSLLTLFSLAVTPSIESSAPKVLGYVLGISFYYALIRAHRENGFWPCRIGVSASKSAWLVLFALFIGAGIAMLGFLGADWFSKYPLLTKITAQIPQVIPSLPGAESGFQPNAISGTLTFFTPLTAYCLLGVYQRWGQRWADQLRPLRILWLKIILWIIMVVEMLWWGLAQTRGAWLGLGAGFIFLFFWVARPQWRWAAWGIPLILVVAAYVYWFQTENIETVDLGSLTGSNLTGTLAFRLTVWNWAAKTLQDFPFTGVGYNLFRQVGPWLYFGPDLGDVAHAHNIWLDTGVTLGYGGIVVYLAIWLSNGYTLLRTQNQNHGWVGRAAIGLLAGWFAHFIFGLADTIPLGSKLGLAIWITLALGQILADEV